MNRERSKKEISMRFDPRTKIILLIICVLAATTAPSLLYEFVLVCTIATFGIFNRKIKYSVIGIVVYILLYLFTLYCLYGMSGILQTSFVASLGLFHKVYPCGMLAGIILSTTDVSEFLSAMNRIHAPKKLVIPLAVMLRYIPTILEDWHFIKDAMKMRNVSPSLLGLLKNPAMTVGCVYIPMMIAASKAADELAIVSVSRGIENPKPRTCLLQIKLHIKDYIAIFVFLAVFLAGRII